MWNLYRLGSQFGTRPSEILGVDDPWAAYQVDMGCLGFGSWVEARLAERDKKGKPMHSLEALLAPAPKTDQERRGRGSRFRSLRGRATRKVKIGADGVW